MFQQIFMRSHNISICILDFVTTSYLRIKFSAGMIVFSKWNLISRECYCLRHRDNFRDNHGITEIPHLNMGISGLNFIIKFQNSTSIDIVKALLKDIQCIVLNYIFEIVIKIFFISLMCSTFSTSHVNQWGNFLDF